MVDKQKYYIGIDIGTASVGWSIMDENYNLMRKKGKNTIGVRLFSEGNTAEERRGFRTNRRRLKRRKWRLNMLQDIFAPHIQEVDENFLARLKYSDISPKDNNKKYFGSLLFPELPRGDKDFYDNYPTIYHLRHALMTEDKKFDIREIYLAMHHIVKYRGHFLNDISANDLDQYLKEIDLKDKLESWLKKLITNDKDIDDFESLFKEYIANIKFDQISSILQDTKKTKNDKINEISNMVKSKQFKISANDLKKVIRLIVGNKVDIKSLILLLDSDTQVGKYDLQFSSDDVDTKIVELYEYLNDEQVQLFINLKELYFWVELNQILPDGKSVSEKKVEDYINHKEQLKLYKEIIKELNDSGYIDDATVLKESYGKYIDGHYYQNTNIKKYNYEAFLKDVLTVFKKHDNMKYAQDLDKDIQENKFLIKQRTTNNNVIPHQAHQLELDKIIENQAKYYPWLAEMNPVEEHRKFAPYKLDELITFRVPYYVGPMIDQKDTSGDNGKFAWMKRKADGDITPWNFYEKVDDIESANNFIKRMTTKDTYLYGEDVLPKSSLLYQAYTVLNELNNIKVNNRPLEVSVKQKIFFELFRKYKNVTIEKVKNLINSEVGVTFNEIRGFSDETKMTTTLSSYIDLDKILKDELQDESKLRDIENIIEWLTVFEDRNIFMEKSKEISWLTDDQRQQLRQLKISGWGRLSRKLLMQLRDDDGYSIIEKLWKTKKNFQQIITQEGIAEKIQEHNSEILRDNSLERLLDEAYMSPKNKKAIRQVDKVVSDLVDIMGYEPEAISLEFTREDQESKRTLSRKKQLEKMYEKVSKELITEGLLTELDSQKKINDKLMLYFTQLGRDAYSAEPIHLSELYNYEIDHIIPQSMIKDDSLNNRVLVHKKYNISKSDKYAMEMFGNKKVTKNNAISPEIHTVADFWRVLNKQGLISKRKLENLLLTEKTVKNNDKNRFIARQLVETSTTIKFISGYLNDKFENTKIIEVKSSLTSQIRKDWGFTKIRELNDYHHAFDAYLSNVIGKYLIEVYPKLNLYYQYGEFKKLPKDYLDNIKNTNVLYKLLNFRVDDSIEIFKNLNTIYDYTFIPVSRELERPKNKLFKQTIFKAGSKKTGVSTKAYKDFSIYGGYSQLTLDFMSLIKIQKKSKVEYKLISINTCDSSRLTSDKNNTLLKSLINKEVSNNFELLIPRIYPTQIIKNDGIISLVSGKEYKNAQQLVLKINVLLPELSIEMNKLNNSEISELYSKLLKIIENLSVKNNKIIKALEDNSNINMKDKCIIMLRYIAGIKLMKLKNGQLLDDELNDFYNILINSMKFMYLFKEYVEKFDNAKTDFEQLDKEEKIKIVNQLMTVLRACGPRQDIKIKSHKFSSFGRFNSKPKLSDDTKLIYTSPSGLNVVEKRLGDLKPIN